MLTVDVEDWFHVDNLRSEIPRETWDEREQRVEINTRRLLDLFDEHGAKATFFVLGWVADRFPALVEDIHERGHEVASHGYAHRLAYDQPPKEFRDDLRRSKRILEDLTGERILGYRAPNFSIDQDVLHILEDEGFVYDSSYFPSSYHDRYGDVRGEIGDGPVAPVGDGELVEVPIPTLDRLGLRLPWGGGGYFRAIPYFVFRWGIDEILDDRSAFMLYLHPWEIDPDQPRVDGIPTGKKIRHYLNLHRTFDKLDRLLDDFAFVPISKRLERRLDRPLTDSEA